MARITLRLPDDLHLQLHFAAERTGMSLNQVIVAALRDSLARAEGEEHAEGSLLERVQHIRRTLGDLAVGLNVRDLPPHLRPSEDLPDTDTLRQSMPKLVPSLSAMIIADREDRL